MQQNEYIQGQLASAREQLATGMPVRTAEVASTSAAENYRPRGARPKNQLTGTDVAAYAPWKWAVNEKLRIDAVIYPTPMDQEIWYPV